MENKMWWELRLHDLEDSVRKILELLSRSLEMSPFPMLPLEI